MGGRALVISAVPQQKVKTVVLPLNLPMELPRNPLPAPTCIPPACTHPPATQRLSWRSVGGSIPLAHQPQQPPSRRFEQELLCQQQPQMQQQSQLHLHQLLHQHLHQLQLLHLHQQLHQLLQAMPQARL